MFCVYQTFFEVKYENRVSKFTHKLLSFMKAGYLLYKPQSEGTQRTKCKLENCSEIKCK